MKKVNHMRVAHAIGGTLNLTGLLLGIFVNPNWFWLCVFVGVNMLQNSITNWCLISDILNKFGIRNTLDSCAVSKYKEAEKVIAEVKALKVN